MQNSNRNSVESALQNKAVDAIIDAKIGETLSPVMKEKDMLKRKVEELQKELKEKEVKFGSVRQQLQILHFLVNLDKLVEGKKVMQLGVFFSALLNRHSQRARMQFSALGELFYSNNKQEAKNIKKDLLQVQKLFVDFGLPAFARKVQKNIDKLDEKHGFKNL
jgi:hypothetical protein